MKNQSQWNRIGQPTHMKIEYLLTLASSFNPLSIPNTIHEMPTWNPTPTHQLLHVPHDQAILLEVEIASTKHHELLVPSVTGSRCNDAYNNSHSTRAWVFHYMQVSPKTQEAELLGLNSHQMDNQSIKIWCTLLPWF